MAVPKKRHSTTRRDKRRSHDALTLPFAGKCPQCSTPVQSHRACSNCGQYKGEDRVPKAD